MASKAEKRPPDATPEDEAWGAGKLLVLGLVALGAALSIIIFMGSRFEGCAYVDGSRPGHAIGR
jgi:hypothetical protein